MTNIERKAIKLSRENKWGEDHKKLRITGITQPQLREALLDFYNDNPPTIVSSKLNVDINTFSVTLTTFLMSLWQRFDSDHIVFSYPRGEEKDILIRHVDDSVMDDIESTRVLLTTQFVDIEVVEDIVDKHLNKLLRDTYPDKTLKHTYGLYPHIVEIIKGLVAMSDLHRDLDMLDRLIFEQTESITRQWFSDMDTK